MTITVNLKPNTKTVKFGEYGTFTVRPLGAGEELALAQVTREANEANDELDHLDEYVEAEKKGDKEKAKEGMKKVRTIREKIEKLHLSQIEILRGTVSSKIPGAVDKLFNENSLADLSRAIREALNG